MIELEFNSYAVGVQELGSVSLRAMEFESKSYGDGV